MRDGRYHSRDMWRSSPAVQQAIAQARPLIAGFGEHIVTEPLLIPPITMLKQRGLLKPMIELVPRQRRNSSQPL